MHEVALASGIVDVACEAAKNAGAALIKVVHLEIGELTCVQAESLDFAFRAVSQGTAAEGARLQVASIPVAARCLDCGSTDPVEDPLVLVCRRCSSPLVEVARGRELNVKHIEVD